MYNFIKILPAAAIVVGLVGSAFTSASSNKIAEANIQQPSLYWHQVRDDNTLGAPINATPQTKNQSMPSGSNPLTSCNDNSAVDCLQGFDTPQSEGSATNPSPSADERIGYN